MKKQLKIPKFKSEDEERNFWSKVDLSDYLKSEDFVLARFPNLKPTSHSISIRIPNYILIHLKERAHELNIPYQTLMKQYIANGVLRDKGEKNAYQTSSVPKRKN